MRSIAIVGLVLLLARCHANRALMRQYRKLPAAQRSQAHSLLRWGLDHEALYTLADTLNEIDELQLRQTWQSTAIVAKGGSAFGAAPFPHQFFKR
jgi:hypothetical protein